MAQNNPTGISIQDLTKFLPLIPAIGLFAGLVTFLGRLYLESYYSYFGIPPSALEMDVQDYTFGSFQMILFVLVVTVSVSVYWMMDKPGFLGGLLRKYGKKFIYDFIVLVVGEWRNRVAKNPYARANQQAGRTASHASSNRIIRFFRWIGGKILKSVRDSSSFVFMTIVWISITVLIISIAIFIALIVTAVILTIGFLGFAILGIGASLNLIDFLPKIHEIDWDLWNVPRLRGLVSGGLLALGTLLLISFIEALMSLWGEAGADTVSPVAAENASVPVPSPPEENSLGGQEEGQPLESGMEKQHDSNQKSQVSSTNNFHRRWVSPVVLIIVIITAMPVVAHFMARDQAIADLNTNVSRFFLAARCRIFLKGAVGRRRNLVEGKY